MNLNAVNVCEKLKKTMNNISGSEQLLQVYIQLLNEGKPDKNKRATDVLKKSIEDTVKSKDATVNDYYLPPFGLTRWDERLSERGVTRFVDDLIPFGNRRLPTLFWELEPGQIPLSHIWIRGCLAMMFLVRWMKRCGHYVRDQWRTRSLKVRTRLGL
ncbi:hypothetical protein TNCV_762841 [Trichonephila clavipes]|nr:hypothetical protein TNCV_762841 [Trichonephila clavipes]